MICYNCQKDIVSGSRYCYHCGAAQQTFTPPPPPRSEPSRPLRRSRHDKAIAGVCAGFAKHFTFDIALVRIVFALVTLFTFPAGVIAYLACWIIIPMEEIDVPASSVSQSS